MKNIYFISDAHLSFKADDREREKRKKLLDFLEYTRTDGEAQELYLLGDLFDFWFEWYHVIPKYWFPVLYRLRELVDSGIIVNFLPGNHDFYTGRFLQEEVGLTCFKDSCEFERGGKRFFLAHGDGYAQKDRGYRLLKKIIRSPVSIFLYKTFISPDLGMQIARAGLLFQPEDGGYRQGLVGRRILPLCPKKIPEGFDYVIVGHIHYPVIKEEAQGGKIFACCGDWMTQFSYARFDGKQLTLEYWVRGLDPPKTSDKGNKNNKNL